MVAIYYPYWEGGAAWEELKHSMRSLEKHLKEDFTIYLVGDKPEWVSEKVVHVPYTREDIGKGSALHNAIKMQQLFLSQNLETDDFIRMNDDIYLLDDITLDDLRVTRIIRTAEEAKGLKSGGALWRRFLNDTIKILQQKIKTPVLKGYTPGFVSSAHCPELFSVKKMKQLYKDYKLGENKFLIGTLYFNVYPFEKVALDKKTERALFYGYEDEYGYASENIHHKIKGKKYLNHNDSGLNDKLKAKIEKLYPTKSVFENE